MTEPMDPSRADKRTAKRYLNKKLLDEKGYDKYLKSLPDLAERAAPVETTVVDDEQDQAEE